MTCEYFSVQDGKVFCKAYGLINASLEKARECHLGNNACYEKATKILIVKIKEDLARRQGERERRLCSKLYFSDERSIPVSEF